MSPISAGSVKTQWKYGHGQQLGRPLRHPFSGRRALALGAMPIATAVVGDDRVAAGAVLAARDVPAEGRRAAALDGAHHLQLADVHVAAVGSHAKRARESRKMSATSRRGRAMTPARYAGGPSFGRISRSSGLITVRSVLIATWV